MNLDQTIIGWDAGRDDVTIEAEWRRSPNGAWELVGWKVINHGSEAVIVEPPPTPWIAEPRP